jgi:hypothetical protein
VLEPVGRLPVKGRVAHVDVMRLASPRRRDAEPRTQPLIGRAAVLELLGRSLEGLRGGRGGVALVVGGAGIRKTRLVEELRALAGTDVTWLEGHFLSYGGPPSWPFEEILRNWLRLAAGEPEIATRAKARARLGALLGNDLSAWLAPLGRLLRVRLDPGPDTIPAPAESVRRPTRPGSRLRRGTAGRDRARGPALGLARVARAGRGAAGAHRSRRRPRRRHPESRDRRGRRFRMRALDDFAHRTIELRLSPLGEAEAAALACSLAGDRLDETTRHRVLAGRIGAALEAQLGERDAERRLEARLAELEA